MTDEGGLDDGVLGDEPGGADTAEWNPKPVNASVPMIIIQ